jgi:glycosyltransferase involved in cell wall biosynthesis
VIKPIIVLQAPVETRSGYGEHARDIARSLFQLEDKFDIKFASTRWGNCPMNVLKDNLDDPFYKKINDNILTQNLTQQPVVHIQMSVANEFRPQGKYNIGITAGIESTLVPADWIEPANLMDLIIVPSTHSKQTLINTRATKTHGNQKVQLQVTKPVEVLFEGFDSKVFTEGIKEITSEKLKNDLSIVKEDFCYLFVGHWMQGELGHDRKNVGMAIKTFFEVFKNKKKAPALILKVSSATFSIIDQEQIITKIQKIMEQYPNDELPNVYIVHGDLTPTEMNELYNHPKIKAHISFTKGEGFGRPLLESTISGKPVIAPNWSGPMDFLDKELSPVLEGELESIHPSAVNKFLIKEAQWFKVNYSKAAQTIEDVYSNYEKYKSNAVKQSKKNSEKFDLNKIDKDFMELWKKYVPEFTQQVGINLPQSQGAINLPKLKKAGDSSSSSNSIQLPKLKKVSNEENKSGGLVLPKLKKKT